MRAIRPGVRLIVLAPSGTPEEIIAALRARVFICKTAPFDPSDIATYAEQAAASTDSLVGIEVLSAHRDWISLRINFQILSADRLVAFLKEMQRELPETPREELMMAFREILMNAIEHGAEFGPERSSTWQLCIRSVPSSFTSMIRARDFVGSRFHTLPSAILRAMLPGTLRCEMRKECAPAASVFSSPRAW